MNKPKKSKCRIQRNEVLWCRPHHLFPMIQIEGESFVRPWGIHQFRSFFRRRDTAGLVISDVDDRFEEVKGFALYIVHRDRLHIANMGVSLEHRRDGVGTLLVNVLKKKIQVGYRDKLTVLVDESWFGAQLFFREMGFVATGVQSLPDGQCGYSFIFRREWNG